MPEMNDMRDQLFSDQKALLEALLLDGAPIPPGFDCARVEEAGRALKRKRKRTMLRACPQLLQIFSDSDSLSRAMELYFSESPSSPAEGPYSDSLAFIIFLGDHPQSELQAAIPANLLKQARKQRQKSWFTMMGSKFDFRLWC